jgi:hypothetical protein
MERHAESHREGKVIKTYRVKGRNRDRPEVHLWTEATKKYFPGPGAVLKSITPPAEMHDKEEEGLLRCRKCHKTTAFYSDDMESRSTSVILAKLPKHRDICVSVKKKKQ